MTPQFSQHCFKDLHSRLAHQMMNIGFTYATAGLYAQDLLEKWIEVFNSIPKDDVNGVPVSIELLPVGTRCMEVIERAFPELGPMEYEAINAAWCEMRGVIFTGFITTFLDETADIHEEDLVFSFSDSLHLIPDNELTPETGIAMRMFTDVRKAIAYGCAEDPDDE